MFSGPAARNLTAIFLLAAIVYTMPKEEVTVVWDDTQQVSYYDVRFDRIGSSESHFYTSTERAITVKRPKSGKWMVSVRGCKKLSDTEITCSPWCSSHDTTCAKLIDGVTSGEWEIYWKPKTPLLMGVE